MGSEFKLGIELIPFYSIGYSLSNILPRKEWTIIREDQLKLNGNKCSICGDTRKKLFCHEVWDINDDTLKQKLKGFKIVCQLCNDVIHIGQALRRDNNSDYREILTKHFMKVNDSSQITFENHFKEAYSLLRKRDYKKYKFFFGKYKPTKEQFLLFDFKNDVNRFETIINRTIPKMSSTEYFRDLINILTKRPKYLLNFKDRIVELLIKVALKDPIFELHILYALSNKEKLNIAFLEKWKLINPNNLDLNNLTANKLLYLIFFHEYNKY